MMQQVELLCEPFDRYIISRSQTLDIDPKSFLYAMMIDLDGRPSRPGSGDFEIHFFPIEIYHTRDFYLGIWPPPGFQNRIRDEFGQNWYGDWI